MKRRETFYAIVGGCVGAVLTMVVCSFFPLQVQSQRDSLGEITCTGLRVVDSNGDSAIHLGFDGKGGLIEVWEKGFRRMPRVWMGVGEHGGGIDVKGKGKNLGGVTLKVNTQGGLVGVFGSGDEDSGQAIMRIESRAGKVSAFKQGKNTGHAHMTVDVHGGNFGVYGNGSSLSRAIMGVNEYGNGVVNTWDKNGYRR